MYQFVGFNESSRQTTGIQLSFGEFENVGDFLSKKGYGFQVLTVSGRGFLSVENELVEVRGRHGRYFKKAKIGSRKIEVVVKISAKTNQQLRRLFEELNYIFINGQDLTPQYLSFSDETDRCYFALLQSATEPEDISNEQIITLHFVCPDPFKYSSRKSVVGNNINYTGDEFVFPTVKVVINQSGNELRLTHVESGKYVRIRGSFMANDVLLVNMWTRSITYPERRATFDFDMVNSRFFALEAGENHLSTNLRATLTTTYREVYK